VIASSDAPHGNSVLKFHDMGTNHRSEHVFRTKWGKWKRASLFYRLEKDAHFKIRLHIAYKVRDHLKLVDNKDPIKEGGHRTIRKDILDVYGSPKDNDWEHTILHLMRESPAFGTSTAGSERFMIELIAESDGDNSGIEVDEFGFHHTSKLKK